MNLWKFHTVCFDHILFLPTSFRSTSLSFLKDFVPPLFCTHKVYLAFHWSIVYLSRSTLKTPSPPLQLSIAPYWDGTIFAHLPYLCLGLIWLEYSRFTTTVNSYVLLPCCVQKIRSSGHLPPLLPHPQCSVSFERRMCDTCACCVGLNILQSPMLPIWPVVSLCINSYLLQIKLLWWGLRGALM